MVFYLCVRACPFPDSTLTNFTVPIVLAVSEADKQRLERDTSAIALMYQGEATAVLRQPEFYPHRKVSGESASPA